MSGKAEWELKTWPVAKSSNSTVVTINHVASKQPEARVIFSTISSPFNSNQTPQRLQTILVVLSLCVKWCVTGQPADHIRAAVYSQHTLPTNTSLGPGHNLEENGMMIPVNQ